MLTKKRCTGDNTSSEKCGEGWHGGRIDMDSSDVICIRLAQSSEGDMALTWKVINIQWCTRASTFW